MQFGQSQEQPSCAKAQSHRITLPGRAANAKRPEETRHQIVYKVTASASSLHKNACQIRADVVVYKVRARLIDERDRQRHLYPVLFFVLWALSAHQTAFLLSQTHRQQILYGRFRQIFADLLRQIIRKCIDQLLVQ